jgi:hypothetical protein
MVFRLHRLTPMRSTRSRFEEAALTSVPRALRGALRASIAVSVAAAAMLVAPRAFALDPPARPQLVAVLPPTGDNIAPELLRAARDLLKDHLQRTGSYAVIEPPLPPPVASPAGAAPPPGAAPAPGPPPSPAAQGEEPTAVDAARLGAAVGAELTIVLRLTHFGSSALLRLTAYATGTAQVAYWDSILITGGPDELDVAIQRLVHGMQTGKPVRESAELETVTSKETMNLNRREANKTFGVRISELAPFNAAGNNFDTLTAGGLVWLYDARSWMADLAVDIGGGAEGRFFMDAAIGAYYPLLREDFTPYLGGQVRWASMQLGGQGASGLVLQPTLGLLLGRLSSVQVRAEVGYFFNTFAELEVASPSGTTTPSPARHYSDGFVFSVGIGF